MGKDLVPINGIVGILNKFSPESLMTLNERYPEFGDLLKTGLTMAKGDTAQPDGADDQTVAYKKFLAQLSLEGMKEAIKLCDMVLPQVKKKLLLSSKLRFSAQIITIIAGASIFTLLSQDNSYAQLAKYISAVLVLVGTLLPLAAQYVEGGLFQSGDTVTKVYEELVDCKVEANQILPQIEYCVKTNLLSSITELTERANDLSVNIRNIVRKKVALEVTA